MAYLEFTFASFWHFVGVMILLGIVCQSAVAIIVGVAAALRGANVKFGD